MKCKKTHSRDARFKSSRLARPHGAGAREAGGRRPGGHAEPSGRGALDALARLSRGRRRRRAHAGPRARDERRRGASSHDEPGTRARGPRVHPPRGRGRRGGEGDCSRARRRARERSRRRPGRASRTTSRRSSGSFLARVFFGTRMAIPSRSRASQEPRTAQATRPRRGRTRTKTPTRGASMRAPTRRARATRRASSTDPSTDPPRRSPRPSPENLCRATRRTRNEKTPGTTSPNASRRGGGGAPRDSPWTRFDRPSRRRTTAMKARARRVARSRCPDERAPRRSAMTKTKTKTKTFRRLTSQSLCSRR